ncbi:hypothetical protein LEP1GSC055_2506 [Leptospira borgpetersenii str. Brem 307]|nr:hypothetical protein LEP1GSC055_2506 [Leptospira borgpetersenii str. Brem 307]EMN18641.1 hypothetical protein LEP1GSC056_2166 [Leptospira borgpetersenii str. Brem 328]
MLNNFSLSEQDRSQSFQNIRSLSLVPKFVFTTICFARYYILKVPSIFLLQTESFL